MNSATKPMAKQPAAMDIIATIDRLNEEAAQLERMAPADMLTTAQRAHRMAVEANYANGIASSLAQVGKAHLRLGNLTEADKVLAQAQASTNLDPWLQAEIYNARGVVYLYLKIYDKAFSYYQEALNLARNSGHGTLEARLLNNIGEIYRDHKDFETALHYYRLSFQAQSELGDSTRKSVPVSNLGATYLEMNDINNAELYAREAVRIAREQKDQMVESVSLQHLGIIAKRKGQRAEALGYLNESLAIYRNTREIIHAVEVLTELHRLHFEEAGIELSLEYLHEALQIAEESDSLSLRFQVFSELAKAYESTGDTKKALHYYRQSQETIAAIDRADREQRLRAIGIQIAADESYQEKEAYRTLNEELDQKARELEGAYLTLQAISDIGKSITATLNLEHVFALVHQHLQELMEADAFAIGLYNREANTIDYHYLVEDGEQLSSMSVSLDSTTSFAAACFKQNCGFVVNSLDDISGYVDNMDSHEGALMSALMFQPLTVDGETTGVLSVQSRKEGVYSERTLEVLGLLSSYLSIAIQNARKSEKLHEEIQQRELAQQELQHLNNELANLSNLDGLTNIANRRRLDDFLQHTWYIALREKLEVSLLMIDVDFLKEYNDFYGHLAGDEVIKQIAQALQKNVKRRTDLVARYGGDEFVVILGGTGADIALQVAQDIQAEVARLTITHEASPLRPQVTLSVGVTTKIPSPGTKPSDLIAQGDLALYQAKQAGRDRIEVAQ